MRTYLDVLRFELRQHLTSPLLWGLSAMFFAMHLLTLTRTGINLGSNELVALNSPWLIFQTVLVLGVFGMVPAMFFAVTAITRDAERRTSELFFTTPVSKVPFLCGRFSAGALVACLVGCIGISGALLGSFMPWLDSARVAPFDWRPWVASLTLLVLPNLLVFCALFFSVAALTRSTALTFGAALGVIVFDIALNAGASGRVPAWLQVADPFGALPVADVSRYWTVAELNTRLPIGMLGMNRMLWVAIAVCVLFATLRHYRMELPVPRASKGLSWPWKMSRVKATDPARLAISSIAVPIYGATAALNQLLAQTRMDWRGIWRSPMYPIVLVLAALTIWAEAQGSGLKAGSVPLYPATSLLLDFFRVNLLQIVLLALIYFSATAFFRERDARLDGIVGAMPYSDWVPVVSKTLVLVGVVLSVLAAGAVSALFVQLQRNFHDHAIDTLLQGVFVYNGFYYCMLAVLAALVQVLSPGKWSGMALVLMAFVAVLVMRALGVEHLLLGFYIPSVVHSDMNGFGHFRFQTYSLIVYWAAFCVLLLIAAHVLYPRGHRATWNERLREARVRLSRPLYASASVAFAALLGAGAWIFYNTNILNEYVTSAEVLAAQAQYELDYGVYRNTPAPSIVDPRLHVEMYPSKRLLTAWGSAGLRNNTAAPIGEFVMSADTRAGFAEVRVDGAGLVRADAKQGFYLFRPEKPLAPGEALQMHWTVRRENRGFPNNGADSELIANGSYLRRNLPAPGYCVDCELTTDRQKYGLPPKEGLPALGDPAHLGDLWQGIDSRSSFGVTIGTDADQTAVGPGVLRREWTEGSRRYFEYSLEGPVWPLVTVQSARYAVTRDRWNDVALEIYHDPRHGMNPRSMIESAKKGLEYYSREFAPYPLPYYRIAEYARYRSNVQAGVGVVAYSEGSGFMVDLRNWEALDYATLHELAHQWWGNVYGARMQGRQFLNEGLAQYSTLMAYKTYASPAVVRRITADMHDGYLNARSGESVAEQPIAKVEDQGYISYNKAPLALFALQEVLGQEKVNGALRRYHQHFAAMRSPFPTSLDLINELRAAAGPEYQAIITDLFEKIMLYDVAINTAEVRRVGAEYEVTLDIHGRQLESNGNGEEREVPLDAWFQVVLFPDSSETAQLQIPIYQAFHRLHSGSQKLVIRVPVRPGAAGVDPFHLMIDRQSANNVRDLEVRQ